MAGFGEPGPRSGTGRPGTLRTRVALFAAAAIFAAGPLRAGTLTLAPEAVTEWKPIYGTVAPRNDVPARARIGGVIEELVVTEGDTVSAGQPRSGTRSSASRRRPTTPRSRR